MQPTSAFLLLALLSTCASEAAAAGRKAVIFISTDQTGWQRLTSSPRNFFDVLELEGMGYDAEFRTASIDAIAEAIADDNVKAISYFGHGSGATMESIGAKGWVDQIDLYLMKKYRSEGMSLAEARAKADEKLKGRNFGKEMVRNYSCHSLSDDSLAKLLVKPGGYYWGVPHGLTNCPSPANIDNPLTEKSDYLLTAYRVPYALDPTLKPLSDKIVKRLKTMQREKLEALLATIGEQAPVDFYACLCAHTTVYGAGAGHSYALGKCIRTGPLGGQSEVPITGVNNQADWDLCLAEKKIYSANYPYGTSIQDALVDAVLKRHKADTPEVGDKAPASSAPVTIEPAIPPVVRPER